MTKPQIFQLRLPPDLHKAIRKAAFEAELSMNKFIVWAIQDAIDVSKRWEKTKDKLTVTE